MSTEKPINGRRNLIILGFGAISIAVISTLISLNIYTKTGDIFLDRSRPGYIFENEKHNEEDDQKENFSNTGAIDKAAIEEYLKEFDKINERINASSDDFSQDAISDDSLGITPRED